MLAVVFANPKLLYLLLIIPLLVVWYVFRLHKSRPVITLSVIHPVKNSSSSLKVYMRHLPFVLRVIIIMLIIVSLARPQSTNILRNVTAEGIDIILSIDVSGSMLARDFKPDRLEAAKDLSIKFISGRTTDRMGLVVFAGESFTLCPLTTDRPTLINQFRSVDIGVLDDGTAIGSGLATAIARLKDSDAKSRVIILLTDGVNNRGEIAPLTAAEMAKTFGIRVYTIGVGTRGVAPYPVQTPFGTRYQDMKVEIDEELLKNIAQITGGEYFRATSNRALEDVYKKIDELEKSKIEVNEYSKREEKYRSWLFVAFLILVGEFLIRRTYLLGI